ncbi:SH3 domain-containing protein [Gluconacetobacter sp.]|uniref:SH3 domain-containing protein n=1 Tax=Gluconacetobacter sp. TaxID=1935994 RepID=UPI0039EAF5E3
MMPTSSLALLPAPRRITPRGCAGWMLCATLLVPLMPNDAAATTPEPSKTGHHHHHHAAKATAGTKATGTKTTGPAHHKRHRPAAASGAATTLHHGHPATTHAGATAHHHGAIVPHPARSHHAATAAAAAAAGLAAAAAPTPAAPAGGAAVAIPPAAMPAEPAAPTDKGSVTGLPLPRFAALRADEVNMRSGPGQRYPIEWVYHRRDLPVKIEREFDVWRLVEDSDGQKGWVHQATLVGTRSFVIPGLPPVDPAPATPPASPAPTTAGAPAAASPAARQATNPPAGHFDSREVERLTDPASAASIPGAVMLRSTPDAGSALIAVLKPGTVGILRTCAADTTWCRVSVQHYSGWLDRKAVWGLLPQETIQPS